MSDVVRATLAEGLAGLAPGQRLDAARETARSLAAMLAAVDAGELELTPTERARLEGAHLALDLLAGQADETV